MQGRKTFCPLTILSVLLQISLEKNSIPFVTFFGTNRKIKEVKRKKAKNFMTNFGIFSLAFCFLSTFSHDFSLSFIYIIFFGLLLLQRVIHIFHRVFHTQFFFYFQCFSPIFPKNNISSIPFFPLLKLLSNST